MRISDFDSPASPADPASPRERVRARRLRRAPLLIPHPDPEAEMAGPAQEAPPDLDDVREPVAPRPR